MKEKDFRRAQRRVEALSARWRPLILPDFRVYYSFKDEAPADEAVFSVDPEWHYLQAHIDAYLPVVEQVDDADLEEYLLHEFAHIRLAMLGQTGKKLEERVATELAQAFVRVGRHGEAASG